MNAQNATEMKARLVEKVGRQLDLDAAQKTFKTLSGLSLFNYIS